MRLLPGFLTLTLTACPLQPNIQITDGGNTDGGDTDTDTDASAASTAGTPTTGDPPDGTTTTGPTTSETSSTTTTSSSTGATASTSESTSGDSTTSTTTDPSTGTTGPDGIELVIEGFGTFPVSCELDDMHCGAKTACELVTSAKCECTMECQWVEYDCIAKGVGSYVIPRYKDAPQDFSFGLYALTENDDYGNICACQDEEATAKAFLQDYGLDTSHTWCGLGNWYFQP